MTRFDQCTETCTTDCGHRKGRPVEALRADNERLARRLAGRFEETETLRAEVASLRQQLDEARSKLGAIDDMLRECGIEYPLGAAGVHDLAAMASGRLEELQTAEADRDKVWEEVRLQRQLRSETLVDNARLLDVYRAAGELVAYLDSVGDLRCSAGERVEAHLSAIAAAYRAGTPAEAPDGERATLRRLLIWLDETAGGEPRG